MKAKPSRILIGLAVAILGGTLPTAIQAKPAQPIVEDVRLRAVAAKFDGAILIGEADGSHAILPIGADPVAPNAIWRWASITKQLAVALTMQEVARGRIDLDAPVTRYWPDWKSPEAARIRIRDLLMHRSGLPQPDESKPDGDGIPSFYRSAAVSPAQGAAGFCAGPVRAKTPTDFNYNNCDSIVIGEILARVTGRPFDALVKERFGRRLGMRSLGMFGIGGKPTPHVLPIGEYKEVDVLLNLGTYGASGGAYGTLSDLWKFDRALLRGKLMPNDARAKMWESSINNGFYGFFQWIYPAPLKGCAKPVQIVERQGLVAGIELRNYLLPETGRALIMFSRKRPTELGDPWEGKGFAFDLLSKVACR